MSDEILSPLIGSALRIENRSQLEEFVERSDSRDVVRSASFEELFFTIKHIGLADSLDLLALVTVRQIRGFIDLDCWRKDAFLRRPFMEWIAAFTQMGPEETVRALSGIDDAAIALYLKDIIHVYEVDRDDPPQGTQLIFTPDNRFTVEPFEEGEPTTLALLMLDVLFKYNPRQGAAILTLVRYTTRIELEERAFQNRTSRLEVHGFVDYFEALSIYSSPGPGEIHVAADREQPAEEIPGEESPGNLPSVFADSLMGGQFLLKAFQHVTNPAESDRFAQELTALGNRILSANLVNLGELEGVRPALEEMRDFLTIGLEFLTGGRPELAPGVLRKSYIQTVFKIGFDKVARLRDLADSVAATKDFRISMLDQQDQEFLEAIRRFKPLLAEDGQYRNFQSMADLERARVRLETLKRMVETFLSTFPAVRESFGKTFNTATLQFAVSGRFEPIPLSGQEIEAYLVPGFSLPETEVPSALEPFAGQWLKRMRDELAPLAGKPIDPRFISSVAIRGR